MDARKLIAAPPRVIRHKYDRRDTILYALGVGAGQDPATDELRFVYEDRLETLPTMAVILAYPGFWQKEAEFEIDWRRVLHAEQSCTFHRPLPSAGEVIGELVIDAIVDKGASKGSLLRATRRIYDAADRSLLATVRQISFLRGDGGGGSHGAPLPSPRSIPDRDPDAVVEIATRPEQALIYRLSGDYNPLHIDPDIAAEAGVGRPILHGLCTYGIAGRAIIGWSGAWGAARLTDLDCRFTAPVYPGDTLQLSLWTDEMGIAFQMHVAARSAMVIDCGFAGFTR